MPVWKQAPFIRFIIPLIFGIMVSWYLHIKTGPAWRILILSILLLLIFNLNKIFIQFKYSWCKGILLNIIIFGSALLLVSYNDPSNNKESLDQIYKNGDIVVATLEEPLTEKLKTFKTQVSVQSIIRDGHYLTAKTNILVYIQKDSALQSLTYGTKIIFSKTLQPIKNSGNPGGFDYERYCVFQGIGYQVYLKKNEFIVLPIKEQNVFKRYLFSTREKLLTILRTYLKNEKETGLAEALLIGYKDDLDKDLVRSYSQTGVVHIIAISGLHLALIYGLLQFFLKLINTRKKTKWLNPIILISSLWLFSFLSGASPSVLRSAVMFSFIVIGEQFSKSNSIYNSLAASAFLLLCYNPFWLWDVGFQLSYGAVLSIVVFMKPVYNWFFLQNKMLDLIWKSTSVTIAAQILTSPVSVYYFHQFPNYFLITNLLAVPLSSVILLVELFICIVSFIPVIANVVGSIVTWLIFLLNSFIEQMQRLPFSIWDGLYINLGQLILIYTLIIFITLWLLEKNKYFLFISLVPLLFFFLLRTSQFLRSYKQEMLLVYNVPQHQAIDFIEGRKYISVCDSALDNSDFLKNLYLQPARTTYRISPLVPTDERNKSIYQLHSKRIVVIDEALHVMTTGSQVPTDIIILSKNPSISIGNLSMMFNCKLWIFDSSNSPLKINKWKKECEQLGISYYAVVDKGAFVMNMD